MNLTVGTGFQVPFDAWGEEEMKKAEQVALELHNRLAGEENPLTHLAPSLPYCEASLNVGVCGNHDLDLLRHWNWHSIPFDGIHFLEKETAEKIHPFLMFRPLTH
jgi:hypothetical protein